MGRLQPSLLLLVAAATLLVGAAPAAIDPSAKFTVAFPDRPKHEVADRRVPFEKGGSVTVKVHRFSVEQQSGIFVVTSFEVPPALIASAGSNDTTREELRWALLADTVRGLAGSLGGRVDKTARTRRDGDVEVAVGGPVLGPDGKRRVGLFEARALLRVDPKTGGYVMYTALAATADGEKNQARAEAFVRSFHLL